MLYIIFNTAASNINKMCKKLTKWRSPLPQHCKKKTNVFYFVSALTYFKKLFFFISRCFKVTFYFVPNLTVFGNNGPQSINSNVLSNIHLSVSSISRIDVYRLNLKIVCINLFGNSCESLQHLHHYCWFVFNVILHYSVVNIYCSHYRNFINNSSEKTNCF